MSTPYYEMSFDEIYTFLQGLFPAEFLKQYYILQKMHRFQLLEISETNKLADLFIMKSREQREFNQRETALEDINIMGVKEFIDKLKTDTLPRFIPISSDNIDYLTIFPANTSDEYYYINRHFLRFISKDEFINRFSR